MEPDVAVLRLVEEAGAGDSAHADLPGQIFAEEEIVLIAEFRDIRHDIVGALRHVVTDTGRIEAAAEKIPLLCIQIQQLLIVLRAEIQAGDNGLLKRCGRADRQEIVHLPDPVGDFRRRQRESEPPAGDGIGL